MRRINVLTSTYQHEGIKCIAKSLSQQTFKDFNWIIVDKHYDPDWFQRYCVYGDMSYIYLPEKKHNKPFGWNNARNTGKLYFDAELIIELEDHIWITPDALERFWIVYEKYPDSICSAIFKVCINESMQKCFGKGIITDEDVVLDTHQSRQQWAGNGVLDTKVLVKDGVIAPFHTYIGYEGNICSYPHALIAMTDLWDENMDWHPGFNSYQVSMEAVLHNYMILIDTDTKHYYFEHRPIEIESYVSPVNRHSRWNEAYLMSKYGNKLNLHHNNNLFIKK